MDKQKLRRENVRRIMRERGLKYKDLAKILERSPAQISSYFGSNSNREVGEEFARHIETQLNLEDRSLDQPSSYVVLGSEVKLKRSPDTKDDIKELSYIVEYMQRIDDFNSEAEKPDIETLSGEVSKLEAIREIASAALRRRFEDIEEATAEIIQEHNLEFDFDYEHFSKVSDFILTNGDITLLLDIKIIPPSRFSGRLRHMPAPRVQRELENVFGEVLHVFVALEEEVYIYLITHNLLKASVHGSMGRYMLRRRKENVLLNKTNISTLENVLDFEKAFELNEKILKNLPV